MTKDEQKQEKLAAMQELSEANSRLECLKGRLERYSALAKQALAVVDKALSGQPFTSLTIELPDLQEWPDRSAMEGTIREFEKNPPAHICTKRSDGQMGGRLMTRGVPVLDPKVHLKGATPEKLARALFRRTEPLRPGTRRKPVVRNKAAVEEIATDHPGNGIPHLGKRS